MGWIKRWGLGILEFIESVVDFIFTLSLLD